MTPLREVATINPRFDRKSALDLSEPVTFVPMAAVSESSGAVEIEAERALGEVIKGFTSFQDRDVLVAKITPCFENGKIAHARIPNRLGFGSTEFHVVRADPEQLNDRYLYHFLRQERVRKEGERKMTGSAGQRRVPKNFLEMLRIPLPPLPEQRRIAAILDKADVLRSKRREAIAKLDQLLQSVFLDMFGDPVTNPKGWEQVTFGDLIKVKSGNGLIAKNMVRSGGYPVYGGNGVSGYHDKYMFDDPKIVIGRVGVYCGVIHVTQAKSWVTDNALYVAEVLREINPTFLAMTLKLAHLNQYAGRAAQPLVSGRRIYPVQTIFPPVELQNEYENRANRVRSLVTQLNGAADEVDGLFSSLQQRAFSGQLSQAA